MKAKNRLICDLGEVNEVGLIWDLDFWCDSKSNAMNTNAAPQVPDK